MFLDPVTPFAVRVVTVVGDSDNLERYMTSRFQEIVTSLEITAQVLVSNRLDHLDGNYFVELPLHITVIANLDINPVRQPGLGYSFDCEVSLLAG
jgi:hypothetical protein